MSLPCENARWDVIPRVRRRIVFYLVKESKMSQRECAKKLGVTPAAVSLYLKGKRGKGKEFDERIEKEVRRSARRIAEGENAAVEICRICSLMKINNS